MAKKNKNKSNNSYSGPLPEDDTRTGETNYSPPINNALETLKLLSSIDFLNLNKRNKNNLPSVSFDAMSDNTRTGEFSDSLGFSTATPNAPPPVNNPLQVPVNVTQSNGEVMPTAPQIPVVPTSLNGMTDLINTNQTAQAQQLGVDPAGMAFINQQKAANLPQTEIGSQEMASLFPGMKHNINVGTYGGSIVGSNPIFVPGGNIMAIDPILEKRKLEEAAKIKAAQDAAKNADFTLRKPKELKDKFFQESINKEANALNNEFLKVARDIYGEDYQQVIKNPQMFDIGREYIQTFDSLDLMVEQADQITDVLADMQSNIDKGDKFYSPETMEKLKEYQDMMNEYENGNVKGLIGLRPLLNDLQGGKVLDEYFKDKNIIGSIEGAISGSTSLSNLNDDYTKLTTSDKTKYDENIRILSEQLAKDAFSSEISKGLYTVEDIATRLKGYLQNKNQSKTTISRSTVGDGSSGGSTKAEDLVGLDGAPNNKLINGKDYNMEGEVVFQNKKGATARQSGLISVNADGTEEKLEGILEFRPVTINALRTTNPKANASGGAIDTGVEVEMESQVIPVITAKVIVEEDELDIYGEPTGKKIKVEKDMVLKVDETMEKTLEANPNQLGYESGVIKSAVKKIVGQSKKSSNLAPSEQDVSKMTEEEKIQYYSNLE
jgi:hypothetical protein